MRILNRQKPPGNRKKYKLVSFALNIALLAAGFLAEAQQPTKIPRIGYVSGSGDAFNQGPYVEALRQGLKELG